MTTIQPAFAPAYSPAHARSVVLDWAWHAYAVVVAATMVVVGLLWDISWHMSIGRDTFWTPAHLLIQGGGLLAGVSSGVLALHTTFRGTPEAKASAVSFWGFRAPLGAWVCALGCGAMLTSAPFDDWWHNAYGLDVKIISPPHMVLAAGFFGIELGTVMLLLAFMNRSSDDARRPLQKLFLYVGGTVVCESLLLKMEYIGRPHMHSALFFIAVALGTPAMLVGIAVASRQRWACTIMAAVYTAFGLAFLWILPLVPAQPKLGPVYQQVTHMIPWEFPLLVIVPALAIDLILQRASAWRPLVGGLVTGIVFLLSLIAVQWPFASFLMTPLARNWFFGTAYMDFSTPVDSYYARYEFFPHEPTSVQFWRGMIIAALITCLMTWVGVLAGQAMRKVRR